MTLESGKLNKESKSEKSDIDTLKEMVLSLQSELKKQKEEAALTTSGMDPVMIAKMMAEFSSQSKKSDDIDYQSGIRVEDIPTEDFFEEGITFCAPFTGYAIADDKRKGHRVVLPYNKQFVFFEYQGSRREQQGKYQQMMSFSTYRSQSHKEIEWLRNHTFFGTMFYESTKGLANFDVAKAQKLSRVMTMLSNLELNQIIARAKEYGVAINQDIAVMRSMLAMEMANREIQSEQNSTQRKLEELEKEKKLLLAKG